MKYSTLFGVLACIGLVITCFLPWVYIQPLDLTLNGFNGRITKDLYYGTQAISHIFFAIIMILLFLVPRIWAKRLNIFVGALQLAWAVKNFILFGMCRTGECPERLIGIYLLLFFSFIMMLMALFPKMKKY